MTRWSRHALAAGAVALCAGGAQAAPIGWTVGNGDGSYSAVQLESGVNLDIDGDGLVDVVLEGFDLSLGIGQGYGGELRLSPQTVNAINNEVYGDAGGATFFADADALLASVGPTTAAPGDVPLWAEDGDTSFESRGLAGILFEIPGGSPYLGYLDLQVTIEDTELTLEIFETALRAVPEPGAALLVPPALAALLARRRRA